MKITHTIDIACPPALLWTYLEDSDKLKQWMKGLVEDEPTSDPPTGVGATFRMKIKEGRKISEYDGEILAYDVERHMQVRLTGGCLKGGSMTADYRLTEIGAGRTRLDYRCTGELVGVCRVLSPLMGLIAGMQIRSFFKTLRTLAEAEASSPAMTAG